MTDFYSTPKYVAGPASEETPQVTSDDDQELIDGIGKKYGALAPHAANMAVVQSPDPGDGRQLEFHHPFSSENPVPGKITLEMLRPFEDKSEREDAVAADMLHYIGGLSQDDSGIPVDPKWRNLRDSVWNSRTPAQQFIDAKTYQEEHDPGDDFNAWADRNRKDAYMRAGVFPDRNPEWNRDATHPAAWTPRQLMQFKTASDYLRNGVRTPAEEAERASAVMRDPGASPSERQRAMDALIGLERRRR